MQTKNEETLPTESGHSDALLSAIENYGQTLLGTLRTQMDQRRPIEERWVTDMRNYMSKYKADVYAKAKENHQSSVYVGYTRSKTDAWVAQMTDMLFPADDKNYGIQPTPIPDLEKVVNSDPGMETDEAVQAKRIMDEAVQRARAMESQIDDQLLECDYSGEARWMLHYAGVLGTGIIRGPVVEVSISSKWEEQEGIGWAATQVKKMVPAARCVMPWDFVPDMSATCLDDSEYTFERAYVTKKDLIGMLRDETKERENIKKLIRREPTATHAQQSDVMGYVNQLRTMTGLQPTYKEKRYELWTYHGPVPIDVLYEAGVVDENDDNYGMEVEGVIVMAGDGTVISVNLNPFDTQDLPYSIYTCEPDVSCLFGYGIPYLCRDAQDILNMSWRGMIDNGVTTIGDQIVVNKSVLQPADGSWDFAPNKVWKTLDKSSATANFEANKAFGVFSFQSRQTEFSNMIGMAKAFMDEESGLPMISQGEQGQVTPTLGGMSMLMNAANAVRRRQVKEFDDDITKPLIQRFYAWNMQFNDSSEIKGDMNIVARGTSALLVKEMQTAQIIEMMDRFSAHPHLAPAFDWYNGLESLVKSMSLGVQTMLKPKSEYDQIIQQQQEQAQQQPQDPSVMKAQMDMQLQQMKFEHEKQMEQFKANNDMQLEQVKAQVNMSSQQLKNKELMMRFEAEQVKLQQQAELKLYELAQKDKWNTEKLVTEIKKLRSQQRLDAEKFAAEMKMKTQPMPYAENNFGMD
ncbi:portal protein [Vibrio litoralis]|uniref:portal protein n=1 Tax=Vibrio litoralis TaxID=335972 RepID=UPI000688131D|nr:hypothetical protein [Vibrio litoralis]